ncbi:MAG: Holliday junction resolvase RuvX [Acidimicrobiales bacterium]
MRAVGVDLGSKRIGIAISDSDGLVATPYEVVKRSGDRKINSIILEVEAEILVVGLPLSLNGDEGRAAQGARHEAEEIQKNLIIPVVMHDERFTTVEAERSLKEQDLNAVQRRKIIDKVAATVLLQAWLDGQ